MAISRKIFHQLNKLRGSRVLILGIGNVLKSDDGAGSVLCRQLSGKVRAEIIDAGTVPENYIQPVIDKAPKNLLIVDAVDFKALPGTVQIFKPEQLNSLITSTHSLSPRIFIDMIAGEIDVAVYFIGIQPAKTSFGQALSVEVSCVVQQLSALFISLLA